MNAPLLLRGENLVVSTGARLILDVERLELARGEILALLGPNGSGKTTLLLCLATLKAPDSGRVFFGGKETGFGASSLPYRRRTASVFQEPLLLDATVAENVALGLKLRGENPKRIEEAVRTNLERFGIGHLAQRSTGKLSGGEAQRASLARAFAVSPEILFLDEPFSALDAPTREELAAELRRSLRSTGVSAVFVTHDRSEALSVADRIAVMKDGMIVQTGQPEEVASRPANEFVAAFMGMDTVLEGIVESCPEGMATVAVGGIRLELCGEAAPGEKALIGIRPENVTLSKAGEARKSSARNVFGARVESMTRGGPLCKVRLNAGFTLTAYVTAASAASLGLAEGAQVEASVKATAIHLIRTERS